MDAREFVSAWHARRRRQLRISLATVICVAALIGTVVTMDSTVPAELWRMIVAAAGFVGLLVLAGLTIATTRCPNCQASVGGAIFAPPRCSRCGLP